MRRAIAAMGAALALAVGAGPAEAHVHVERSVPTAGARLQHAPAVVTLWFNAPLKARRTAVRVLDGEGAAIPAAPSLKSGGRRLRIALGHRRGAAGPWMVEFRILAADGHPVTGALGFETAAAPAAHARTPTRPRQHPAVTPLREAGPPAGAVAAARAVEHAALALVLGGLTFLVLCSRADGATWRRPLVLGSLAGVLASGSAIALHALDPAVAGDVLATRAGIALVCALALWIASSLAVTFAAPAVALAVTAPLVVCPAVAGHAGNHAVLVPASALHVAAMSVWLGGLAALWRAARAAPAGGQPIRMLASAATRFSTLALMCATAVLATGIAQSAALVSAPADLVHTTHGRLLALKALLFTVFVAFGVHQRRKALPRLRSLAGRAPRDAAAGLRPALRGELALAAVVLSLAGALAVADPAAARVDHGRGIGGARIGMTEKEVRRTVGRPSRVARDEGATILVYERRKLVVTLLRGRVRIVSTRNRRERTREGVNVGTTRRTLLRRIPRARCRVESGTRFCVVGNTRRGRSTVFLIRSGRVQTITVARA